jgi:hypothetical protein
VTTMKIDHMALDGVPASDLLAAWRAANGQG